MNIINKLDGTSEAIHYFPHTTARGIWQLLERKHITGEQNYGLFANSDIPLDPTRPLVSSVGKNIDVSKTTRNKVTKM